MPIELAFDNSTNTLYVGEVRNGLSICSEQSVYAATLDGTLSTFATNLFMPEGLAISPTAGSAVPEPATAGLLGAGGVLAVWLHGRKRSSCGK